MADGTFVKELAALTPIPQVTDVGGVERLTIPAGWKELDEPRQHEPEALGVTTLTGLRDYLAANVDGLSHAGLMLSVQDGGTVRLYGNLKSKAERFARFEYVAARAPTHSFTFEQFMDAEMFTIRLQTQFVQTPERDELITLVASIRGSQVMETVDDGVSQEVKTARGVALNDRTRVPNPVHLAPFRTFQEVDQPTSKFVLRLKSRDDGKPSCALFQADGGAWELEAIAHVAAWLRENVKDVAVIA